jgi:hypothetical protein
MNAAQDLAQRFSELTTEVLGLMTKLDHEVHDLDKFVEERLTSMENEAKIWQDEVEKVKRMVRFA